MRFSLKPTDLTFFDLFAESAQNLVAGATLLAEMLQNGADRARDRQADARGRAPR